MNQLLENQFIKKEQEMKMLLDQALQLIIKLMFNLLFKEKMLMLKSIDKVIKLLNKNQSLNLHKQLLELDFKLFNNLLNNSLDNQLYKELFKEMIFIIFKIQL